MPNNMKYDKIIGIKSFTRAPRTPRCPFEPGDPGSPFAPDRPVLPITPLFPGLPCSNYCLNKHSIKLYTFVPGTPAGPGGPVFP